MINVNDKVKEHIINDLVENTIEIHFPNNSNIKTITMDNIVEESMTLKQSICSESKLKFGGCIASEFTISVCDTEDRLFNENDSTKKIKGKWIYVILNQSYLGDYIYPSSTLYPSKKLFSGRQVGTQKFNLFCGYVDKFERDADDRHIYKLTAYDYMAKLNQKDGTEALFEEWENATFRPLGVVMGNFINLTHHPYVGEFSGLLATNTFSTGGNNYKIYNYKTKNEHWLADKNSKVTYGDVLKNCCEMIGAFGFIAPFDDALENKGDTIKGNFWLVYLDPKGESEVYDFYENLDYDDYVTSGYTDFKWSYGGTASNKQSKISIFRPDNTTIPSDETKEYDLTSNVICWQNEDPKTTNFHMLNDFYHYKNKEGQPSDVTMRFYNCSYIPFTATVDGRPWVQVGDNVQFNVYETDVNGAPVYENGTQKMTTITSVILSRTLSGIQALTDTLEAKGEL